MNRFRLLAPRLALLAVLCTAGLAPRPAHAWWPRGHSLIAASAIRGLPPELPRWFRDGAGLAAHCAQDPDLHQIRTLPQMTARERPEHFLDWELLRGRPLPATRPEFEKLCAQLEVDSTKVGTLPYAIAEWTGRLTTAFAEARRYPDNRHIQQKALVYAGILAHYSGDLCMPLHTTIHYNGRARQDGSSPRTGIHARMDSLPEKLKLTVDQVAPRPAPEPLPDLFAGILAQFQDSRAQIDRTYALEAQLPPETGEWQPTAEVHAFGLERAQAAARFTAALYHTAWRNSATLQLPFWLDRAEEMN